MKKILILIFLFIGINTYAQTDSLSVSKITETERIIDKYSGKIADAFESLALKLEVPVTHVYNVMITQKIIEGIASVLWVILFITFCISSIYCFKKTEVDEVDELNKYGYILIFLVIGAAITLIGTVTFLDSMIGKIFNPEYYVIKDILDLIK